MTEPAVAAHPSAPPGKAVKYARLVCERRFRLTAVPPLPVERTVSISDRYLLGTALRLRRAVEHGHETLTTYKLTQKIAQPCPDVPEFAHGVDLVTNMYLSEDTYRALAPVAGATLEKTRFSLPPLGVDVFAAPLDGLVMAEIEFESVEAARRWRPPTRWALFLSAGAEVTHDRGYTGGALVVCGTPSST